MGWFVKFPDGRSFFYNLDGFFVPYKRDPSKLGKHQQKVNITKLDADYNFLDNNGCYYDKSGEPLGWKLQCEDGQFYFFDMNGDYVDISPNEDTNDLNDFDLSDFKQDFRQNVQYIKQSQKPYPKEEPKEITKIQPQIQQQKQVQKQQQKPKIPQKHQIINQQYQQAQINQKAIYHYELPDATKETKDLFVALIKSKLEKPEFVKNEQLFTVKSDQGNKQLEQDLKLENGQCVKFKK
ncbi:unnamed protein product (macronuclear) [Paramecium tetraurelia]|uniref:Ubiquitin-like domain-containing protein n=1 Tax=Paramecium tetraurelia TaxID=5888 RepID=A0EEK8_PARTE|nr:uncharacterized protein GSPATT00026071001 [Paramecium tetraurelia]CAK93743.1 unnamed protein product [Paramecium tetraurelia]|eukprot:XP_001461122.1 hypothetical protein (macronuclear) [Paramecium tetraurelia strain d4-2]